MIDEAALGRCFAGLLGVPLRLAAAALPLPEASLGPAEREAFSRLGSPQRRASWLRGRAALRRLGLGPDQPGAFPRADCSLTHSGDWAVAVALPPGAAAGLGVDLELHRAPREEAARKFLSEAERGWLSGVEPAARPAALRRFWTAKEAAFKADPRNAGRTVADYVVEEPGAEAGLVRGPDLDLRVAGVDVGEGRLAVAIAPPLPRR